MSRPLWFVAGAGAGVYAMVRGRRAAEAVTPDGLRDRATGLGLGWAMFTAEVRRGMAAKEEELRRDLARGLPADSGPHPVLAAEPPTAIHADQETPH
ncbi:MAG: DUF6167 family protein [Actinomycetota bacterium]